MNIARTVSWKSMLRYHKCGRHCYGRQGVIFGCKRKWMGVKNGDRKTIRFLAERRRRAMSKENLPFGWHYKDWKRKRDCANRICCTAREYSWARNSTSVRRSSTTAAVKVHTLRRRRTVEGGSRDVPQNTRDLGVHRVLRCTARLCRRTGIHCGKVTGNQLN